MRVLKKEFWPFQLKYNMADYKEVYSWCNTNIGKCGKDWFTYDRCNTQIVSFKRVDDSIAFRLKWSYNGN